MIASTPVGFTPLASDERVCPPFIKGQRNSIWVKTTTLSEEAIKQEAIQTMAACYGIEITDIVVYTGDQFILEK